MPELPEVEFARRQWLRWMRHRRVVRTGAEPRVRTFRGADARAFARLSGRLVDAHRRGKYLLLSFERGGALLHLGMTGKFVRRPAGEAVPYGRARFVLDDGSVIHFSDPRLFGRIEPIEPSDPGALRDLPAVRALGPDPLVDDFTTATLRAAVAPSRQDIKVALMDQSRIAGLGNIHAAEALYRAKIHPARKPGTLTEAEWRRLAHGIRRTLAFALEQEDGEEIAYVEEPGAPNPFLVYGRAGERCRRCGSTVKRMTQAGRTTHYCPGCQPRRPRAA